MSQDRPSTLFFELFDGLPRQGPGDAASTLRALASVPGLDPDARVLDLGCGTGLPTRTLAAHSAGRFLGIDSHRPFIDELNRRAEALGLSHRLEGRVGDIGCLDLAPESFDLVWSEGAIWVLGFEAGLRQWRHLLRPGGHLAVSEACWTRPDRPSACEAYWQQEYPALRDASALGAVAVECGYETVDHFVLPSSSWWDDYYRPLQQNIVAFRSRHPQDTEAQTLADQVQQEIDVWHDYCDYYSYAFFVLRR